MTSKENYTGIKTGVKTAFVRAFRAGLTNKFWQSISPAMQDVRSEDHVLPEFPTVKVEFPIVRVDATVNQVHWQNINRSTDHKGLPQQQGICTANITVYVYAKSAKQRDRITDAYVNMLLFAYCHPKELAFSNVLSNFPLIGIHPILNELNIGNDTAGKGIPWCEDDYVYMSTISFDAEVVFFMQPQDDAIEFIKEINVKAEPAQ